MKSAERIVVEEWQRRRALHLDTSGGWHTCDKTTCNMQHLQEYVCMQGQHLVSGSTCAEHPKSNVLHVTSLYGCPLVGAVHTCSQSAATCRVVDGRCAISGLSCVAAHAPAAAPPAHGKRSRRRQPGVHTNHKVASIMLFNMLFSRRRISSEVARSHAIVEQGRRRALRYIKQALRDRVHLRYQHIVDLVTQSRQTIRNNSYVVLCSDPAVQESICLYYATLLAEIWDLVVDKLPSRNTFEAICAATLYAMRKGLAYDGLLAIPADRFLLYALPDAHSIKDIGVGRRAFTQSRNALYAAVRELVSARQVTVETIALKFKSAERPEILQRHFPQHEL